MYTIPLPPEQGTGLGKALKMINYPRRADIPIWVAALGEKNLEMTAELATGWLPHTWCPRRCRRSSGPALAAGFAKRGARAGPAADHRRRGSSRWRRRCSGPLARPPATLYALYIGGMGARGRNFYNTVFRRQGYAGGGHPRTGPLPRQQEGRSRRGPARRLHRAGHADRPSAHVQGADRGTAGGRGGGPARPAVRLRNSGSCRPGQGVDLLKAGAGRDDDRSAVGAVRRIVAVPVLGGVPCPTSRSPQRNEPGSAGSIRLRRRTRGHSPPTGRPALRRAPPPPVGPGPTPSATGARPSGRRGPGGGSTVRPRRPSPTATTCGRGAMSQFRARHGALDADLGDLDADDRPCGRAPAARSWQRPTGGPRPPHARSRVARRRLHRRTRAAGSPIRGRIAALRPCLVPADLRAALCLALACLPGVRAAESVENVDGVACLRARARRRAPRAELMLSPTDGQFAGERDSVRGRGAAGLGRGHGDQLDRRAHRRRRRGGAPRPAPARPPRPRTPSVTSHPVDGVEEMRKGCELARFRIGLRRYRSGSSRRVGM